MSEKLWIPITGEDGESTPTHSSGPLRQPLKVEVRVKLANGSEGVRLFHLSRGVFDDDQEEGPQKIVAWRPIKSIRRKSSASIYKG